MEIALMITLPIRKNVLEQSEIQDQSSCHICAKAYLLRL